MMNKELVTAEIIHRKDFVAALETVAKLAKQLVGKGWEVPPTYIANECNRWARSYTQTIQCLEHSIGGKEGKIIETGNVAAMREVLKGISENLSIHIEHRRGNRVTMAVSEAKFYVDCARAALAAPPRNCDVLAPEELSERMAEFCRTQYEKSGIGPLCGGCQFNDREGLDCQFAWAQMPYEGGVK